MSKPKQRTTRLDPAVRRELIIEAAGRVFERRDPADVTFEEIAAAAGVSRALVYNYFGDRGGLLAAVYLHTMEALIVQLNDSIAGTLPPEDRMRRIVHGYLTFANDHEAGWRLLQVTAAMRHPALVTARRNHMEQLADWWGGKTEARIVAFGVIGMLEAATCDWLQSRDAELEELSDVLFDLMWFGLSSLDRHGIALPEQRARESVPT
jgi:AcrR family transcriptional regulator